MRESALSTTLLVLPTAVGPFQRSGCAGRLLDEIIMPAADLGAGGSRVFRLGLVARVVGVVCSMVINIIFVVGVDTDCRL